MDLDSTQNSALAKLPLLKQGDYDTWRLIIEPYIELQDYALWEIIEEGNSFKPVARTTTNEDDTSTTTMPGAVSIEQKIQKKNDLKARSILMMALPSEHLLTFNKYKYAKSLFEAIEERFGGNEATKKTQKTLLKQILPSEWGMHVVVWRNKPDLGSISFNDLYNNFKIIEPDVKRSVTSNSNSQNLAFFLAHNSSYDVNTANVHISTGSTPVSTASTNNSTTYLSDATVYAYLATQPNGSQVVHEDLEQIHKDDLDEMNLKWQLSLLSMKARKFYQRTGKKIIINGSDTTGYDKKKVECFNCHKLGHFARECRNHRSQENRNKSQDSSRRTVNVEESSSKAILAIDGTGFDWSYMADEEASTNFALMAFSDSEVQNNKTCSKTCLKNFEDLKSKYDKLRIELYKSKSDLDSYKKSLALVEEQLVFYKKNESMLCYQIAVLEIDASFNESVINALKKQVERLKKEKKDNQFKIDNFENASKSLDQLIGNQIFDNNKKGLGNNDVPLPLTGLFAPPSIDLSNSGLKKFKQPEFEGYGGKVNKGASENVSKEVKKTLDAPIIEDWVSDCDEDETVVLESLNVQKPKQADQPRKEISVQNAIEKGMTSVVREQGINVVKSTTCWEWRPKIKEIDHVSKNIGSCISDLVIPKRIQKDVDFQLLGMTEARDSEVYMITREDGSKIFHGDIQAFLRRLDRHGFGLVQLFSLVQEDSKIIHLKNWELLRWKLHEYSGVHSLFLDGTSIQINMLVEKKYPLKKEILEKMMNLKLEAEKDSVMAFELLQFIKSQIEEKE
ncbi:ribonuclease H-like domain-containing protein [Tanacetum coccineum]